MKRRQGWLGFALVALVLSVVLLGRAFPEMFTGLDDYDDTGYMLALVRQFNAHGGLYTQVFSQYGPLYSQFYAVVCRGLGVPTQDSIRWLVICLWLVGALAGGALAFRLSRSVAFAALAQLFCFSLLRFLTAAPGHPISLCILSIAVAAACVPLGEHHVGPPWRAVAFGMALGALGMIKINLGVFALAAVGTAWTLCVPRDRVGRALRWAAGGLLCLMPVLLVRAGWLERSRLCFIALIIASFVGGLLVSWRDEDTLTWRDAGRLALGMFAGWMLVSILSVASLVATGSRLIDIVDGMLLRPLRFANIFEVDPNMRAPTLLVAALALGGAVAWRLLSAATPRGELRRRRFELGCRALFLLLMVMWVVANKGFSFVMPFLWVVMLPVERRLDHSWPFARRALALLAMATFLSLYPVSATQILVPNYFGTLAAVFVAAQMRAGMVAAREEAALAPAGSRRLRDRLSWRPLALVGAIVLVGTFGVRAALAWRERAQATPLNLPGSATLRCAEGQTAEYRFLAVNLGRQRSFITLPGMNSLYGWAGVDYPTGYNCTENLGLLTPAEQRALVDVGRRSQPVAMLFCQAHLDWWLEHHAPPVGPLVDFLRRDCRALGSVGIYTLMAADGDGSRASPDGFPWTFCATLVPVPAGDGRVGQISRVDVYLPSGTAPVADALIVDVEGRPHGGPLRFDAPSPGKSSFPVAPAYAFELTDDFPPESTQLTDWYLRLRDGAGHRLTTVPFYVPARDAR